MLLILIIGKNGYMPLTRIKFTRALNINYYFWSGMMSVKCLCRHLNGTVLESFVRPAVLITDAFNALNNQLYKRQRDQEFLGSYLQH